MYMIRLEVWSHSGHPSSRDVQGIFFPPNIINSALQ